MIFLFLGSLRTVLVPLVAIPVSLIGAVFLMQVFGFTLNLLTLLAIVLSVGLVVDDAIVVVENVERHIREGKIAARRRARRRARAGRPDHRDDHHAGRGVRADRLPGRPHRRALPRVRLHAGRRGVHLRRRRAHAVADDVVAAAQVRARARLARRARSTAASTRSETRYGAHARRPRWRIAACVYAVWITLSLLVWCRCTCSRPRSSRRTRTRASCSARSTCRPTPRSEQLTPYTDAGRTHLQDRRPSSTTASRSRSRPRGFGGMLVKPWDERKRSIFPIQEELERQARRASPACARRCSCRRRCPAPASSRSSS